MHRLKPDHVQTVLAKLSTPSFLASVVDRLDGVVHLATHFRMATHSLHLAVTCTSAAVAMQHEPGVMSMVNQLIGRHIIHPSGTDSLRAGSGPFGLPLPALTVRSRHALRGRCCSVLAVLPTKALPLSPASAAVTTASDGPGLGFETIRQRLAAMSRELCKIPG